MHLSCSNIDTYKMNIQINYFAFQLDGYTHTDIITPPPHLYVCVGGVGGGPNKINSIVMFSRLYPKRVLLHDCYGFVLEQVIVYIKN